MEWLKLAEQVPASDNQTPRSKKIALLSDLYDNMLVSISPVGGEVSKQSVEQNFNRWFQAWKVMGISPILVFHCPLIILSDYDAYYCQDQANLGCSNWQQHKAQLRALKESPTLSAADYENGQDVQYLRRKIMWHLNPDFGALFKEAAKRNGVKVSTSYHSLRAVPCKVP